MILTSQEHIYILNILHRRLEEKSGIPYEKFHVTWNDDFVVSLSLLNKEERDEAINNAINNVISSTNNVDKIHVVDGLDETLTIKE